MTILGISVLQYALKEMPPEALGLVMGLSGLPLWTSIPLAIAAAFFVGALELRNVGRDRPAEAVSFCFEFLGVGLGADAC